MSSPFVDHVRIYFRSGDGGPGKVSWRREKFVALGGPDGGDGGDGGSIVLEGDAQLWTLLDLKYRKFIKAPAGEPGGGRKKKGRDGQDEVLKVPLGTVAYDSDTGDWLGEINQDGERMVLIPGGKGGLGNWHFRSATNQVPEYAQPGIPGTERTVILELKVLADVGLVGFPNAGKSTLLAAVTSAKPKIADYPFTTLVPNLGIVKYKEYHSFVMADIPGIIEGASEGRGLGTTFLRHIERNAVLLFLVSFDSEDYRAEFDVLSAELEAYEPSLLEKTILIGISKCDLATLEELKKLPKTIRKHPVIPFSSASGWNLDKLKDTLFQLVAESQ